MLQELKYAYGLRNRIVHEYNGIVDKLAFQGIENNIEIFLQYVELISQWLNQA
ncbi:MAG: HepT-like ribonuclease domain-containing protein [Promethearchaeota archaeon]